ncbi:MAG: S-layer family protein [Oscillatoria sp. SIO1A7]|nr:S-layer family protein [Oscillatoria sp. SIO1A7]
MKNRIDAALRSALCLAACTYAVPAIAQVVPDGTLPVNSTVAPNGNSFVIEGGTTAGANLFHSFREFSLPTGSEAWFNNAVNIENILSRVTGGNISNIDGLIRANGGANLFLINPRGIVFGPNASLNIGGSFLGSSANSILFENGLEYNAAAPSSQPLLSINVPIGLQYGNNAGRIRVEGTGHNLSVDFPSFVALPVRDARPSGLQVPAERTLALVGGGIEIAGGNLTAAGGRIELGSVASEGIVSLTPTGDGLTLGYEEISEFGNINLTGASSLEVSGEGGGNIQLLGREISIADSSTILASTLGDRDGGTASIRGTESVEVVSTDLPTVETFTARLFLQVEPGATGNGGDLTISTGLLRIDSAEVIVNTLGQGNAGNIAIRAADVVMTNDASLDATVDTGAIGNGGLVDIQADRLQLSQGSQIASGVIGVGRGGSVVVRANTIDASGERSDGLETSGLYTATVPGGVGNAGDITVDAERVRLAGGAQFFAGTFGEGNAGNITVRAGEIEVIGESVQEGFSSSILTAATRGTLDVTFLADVGELSGAGGNMTIVAETIKLRDGGSISASTNGPSDAGDISISAGEIEISGVSPTESSSRISSSVGSDAIGNGSNIALDVDRLSVLEGGRITASTRGTGNAGSISVQADTIELSGLSPLDATVASTITASSETEGAAGSVNLVGNLVAVEGGATIAVSGTGSGNAGNLNITTDRLSLDRGGSLSAEVFSGDRGNITLNTDSIELRRESSITTDASNEATGGNIGVNTETLTLINNSRITANAIQGAGGNISVSTEGIFVSPDSSIAASSQFGFDGIVEINNPDTDSTSGLVELSQAPVDASDRIVTGCASALDNSFIVTGRGGIPPNPEEQLISDRSWTDLRDLSRFRGEVSKNTFPEPVGSVEVVEGAIVEANSWRTNARGEIELVAVVEASHPAVSSLPPKCQGSELDVF